MQSVSYTHLDVYKRQVIQSIIPEEEKKKEKKKTKLYKANKFWKYGRAMTFVSSKHAYHVTVCRAIRPGSNVVDLKRRFGHLQCNTKRYLVRWGLNVCTNRQPGNE